MKHSIRLQRRISKCPVQSSTGILLFNTYIHGLLLFGCETDENSYTDNTTLYSYESNMAEFTLDKKFHKKQSFSIK